MKFEEPILKVIKFESSDVITTSAIPEDIDNARVSVTDIFGGNFVEDNLFI